MGYKNFSERKNISYVSHFFEYVGKKFINIYNEVTAILDLSKTKFDINWNKMVQDQNELEIMSLMKHSFLTAKFC
jgi:hypothetical protein